MFLSLHIKLEDLADRNSPSDVSAPSRFHYGWNSEEPDQRCDMVCLHEHDLRCKLFTDGLRL